MPKSGTTFRATLRRARFTQTEQLGRVERATLLVILGVMASVDLISWMRSANGAAMSPDQIIGIITTLSFGLYACWPWVATLGLGVAVTASLFIQGGAGLLIAGSLAAFMVLRLGSVHLLSVYATGLLITIVVASSHVVPQPVSPSDIGGYLLIAAIAGTLGFALRMGYERSHLLADQLAEQEAHEREAIAAERQWIAGELHDSIAHQLTVISLHTQLLDDEQMRDASQEAIRSASRKALSDLRYIIRLAEDAPTGVEVPSGDLGDAIEEACTEFRGAGHATVVEGNPRDEGISRGVEIILARVVRESATNVIKYAAPGEVRFVIDVQPTAVTMTITSPIVHGSAPRVASSTGTGINRMAERVLGVSGEFSAGPVGDQWQVKTYLPLGESTTSREATRTAS